MKYLIIEHFHDAVPVYRRFRDQGRMMPDGLQYIASWVTPDFSRCYQIMESADRRPLDEWIAKWSDLIDFEVIPVVTSAEPVAAIGPRL
jgi:hypothetical protein